MKKCFVFILSGLLFISCKENAITGETEFLFDDPQPINDSELSSIPVKFRGEYEKGNGKMLHITDSTIFQDQTVAYHKSGIDSIGTLKNGKFTARDNHETLYAEQKGDSVYFKGIFRDTIFSFSPIQRAKRVNGQLVLSYKDSVSWHIKIVAFEKDSLKIKSLMTREDYIKIQPLIKNSTTNSDTTIVNMKPTRKEFTKILKLKDFSHEMKFKKMK